MCINNKTHMSQVAEEWAQETFNIPLACASAMGKCNSAYTSRERMCMRERQRVCAIYET